MGVETRARSGNECVRQLVHVKHRHRAYAAVATRVPADYSVYLSMRRRGKQRRLSYFATETDSFNKVQRGFCIPGRCITRGVRAAQVTRAFIIQTGSAMRRRR